MGLTLYVVFECVFARCELCVISFSVCASGECTAEQAWYCLGSVFCTPYILQAGQLVNSGNPVYASPALGLKVLEPGSTFLCEFWRYIGSTKIFMFLETLLREFCFFFLIFFF